MPAPELASAILHGEHARLTKISGVGKKTAERLVVELKDKIKTSGLRVVEVPVTVRYTDYSMRKGQHGFQAVRILFDYSFRSA